MKIAGGNADFIIPHALGNTLFGTGDENPRASSLLTLRVILVVLSLACLGFGIGTIHFHNRYEHEARTARQLKSEMRSQIGALGADKQNLQAQVADLSQALDKTKRALALASRPSVSTDLPIPKVSPPTTVR